jgi:hypothetical protein
MAVDHGLLRFLPGSATGGLHAHLVDGLLVVRVGIAGVNVSVGDVVLLVYLQAQGLIDLVALAEATLFSLGSGVGAK